MTSNELSTLKRFVSSNNSFCAAINNDSNIPLEFPLKIELIIYYLTLNKKILLSSDIQHKEVLLSLIENHNFVFDNDILLIEGIPFTIELLTSIINQIESSKLQEANNKIIYLTHINKEPKLHRAQMGQVIQFKEASRKAFYTSLESSIIFERTTKINQDTISYISKTRSDYIALVNDIVLKALSNELDSYNQKYLKIIASYLQLYPFMVYLKDKKDIPFEEIKLPQGQIGLRTTTFDNPLITEIEKNLSAIMSREERLLVKRDVLEASKNFNGKVITILEQELLDIEKEKANLFYGLFLLKNSPELYNENLLTYLVKSFQAGTIDINRFIANPIIKSFFVNEENTEFHCSMRLDTLSNLINPEELLHLLTEQKTLKLDV